MTVIAIESSAHTLGVGICDNGKILANSKQMCKISKGIIPGKTSDFHSKNITKVIKNALAQAEITKDTIDAVGYTKGPGIGPCLRVGQLAARDLANELNVPLFPVNHAIAHVEITKHLFKCEDPLVLYVSGGNSQILALDKQPYLHYRVYGETFDIGIGNMLDNFAREAKMKPAWGSTVDKIASGGKYIEMPYSVKGMDFTFAGLLTHATEMLNKHNLSDVSYSLQQTSFAMLCESVERALLLTERKALVLSGGVAQSLKLQEMLQKMLAPHNAKLFVAPNEFNADNGAMISLVAEKMFKAGLRFKMETCDIDQRYRIDKVRIAW